MVDVAKWLTHRIVAPAFGGSSPLIHPIHKKSRWEEALGVFLFLVWWVEIKRIG